MSVRGLAHLFGLAVVLQTTGAQAYRTNGDLPEFEGTERVRFADDAMVFELVGGSPVELEDSFAVFVRQALKLWSGLACSSLALELSAEAGQAARPEDGRNTIAWVNDDWPYGNDVPAYTDVQLVRATDDRWIIAEADIYLDADAEVFQGSSASRYLVVVLAHEIGHALGLLHPCELDGEDGAPLCDDGAHEDSLMHPIYAPERSEPSSDDEAGLCFLYGTTEAARTGVLPTYPWCEEDDDCPVDLHCGGGYCVGGSGRLGDPCDSPGQCESVACAGFCSEMCSRDADCANGGICDTTTQVIGACVGRGGLGEPCSKPSDCIAGECLAFAGDRTMCTRACSDATPCPAGWTCRTLPSESERVCVATVKADAASCSVGHLGASEPPPLWTSYAALVGLGLLTRRRRI